MNEKPAEPRNAPEKALPQLAPNHLQLFEQVSLRFDAQIAQGVAPEALLDPAFWAHHAVRLRPMNEIRARAEDGTWIAELVVLDCSRTWAKVKMLELYRLTTSDVALTQASEQEVRDFISRHNVVYRGPHKWSVTRKSDKAVLMEGAEQKEGAELWLEAHARSQIGPQAAPRAEQSVTA